MNVSRHHIIPQIEGATDHNKEETSIGTQTEETCPFCKDVGSVPRTKQHKGQALYQLYGQQISGQVRGFPASQLGW